MNKLLLLTLTVLIFTFTATLHAQEGKTPASTITTDYQNAVGNGTLKSLKLGILQKAFIFPSTYEFTYTPGIVTEMEEKFTLIEVAGKKYYAITTSFNEDSVNLNSFEINYEKPGENPYLKIQLDFEDDIEAKKPSRKNYTFLIPEKYVLGLPARENTDLYIHALYIKKPKKKNEKSTKSFVTVK